MCGRRFSGPAADRAERRNLTRLDCTIRSYCLSALDGLSRAESVERQLNACRWTWISKREEEDDGGG